MSDETAVAKTAAGESAKNGKAPDFYHHPWRWVIIAIYGYINFAAIMCTYGFMGMPTVIMTRYSIDTQMFSLLCTIGFLTGFILCLPFGSLADRFGTRMVMIVSFIIVTAAAAVRAFVPTDSAAVLTATQFFFGLSFCAVNATVIKCLGAWFSPKQFNLMIAVYIAIATVGAMVGLASASLFHGDANVMYMFQFFTMLIALLACIFLLKNKPEDAPEPPKDSFFKYLGSTLKFKGVWIAALTYFFLYAGTTASNTFLVAFLLDRGASTLMASTMGVTINATALVGEFLVSALVVRSKGKNPVRTSLIFLSIATALVILISALVRDPVVTMVLINIAYVGVGACLAQTKALPAQIPGLPKQNLGTAGGFQATLQNLGAFVGPTYFVALIAGGNYTTMFVLIAVLFACYFILCLLIPHDVGKIIEDEDR